MPGVAVGNRTQSGALGTLSPRAGGRAFTLIDLLVSLVVVAVLVAILLPGLEKAREATRRVVCASNARQHGLGFAMYANDWGQFPVSLFEGDDTKPSEPQNMILARTDDAPARWDGLGVLFNSGYLDAPQVFYCPSHRGVNPYQAFASAWREPQGKIVINYQYRGSGPGVHSTAERVAFVADSLRTRQDYSHQSGNNVLRRDFSVAWVPDKGGAIAKALPDSESDEDAKEKVSEAWTIVEKAAEAKPDK